MIKIIIKFKFFLVKFFKINNTILNFDIIRNVKNIKNIILLL